MDNATRYPLSWPQGWPRTPSSNRKAADFSEKAMVERRVWDSAAGRTVALNKPGSKRVTLATARERLDDQLGRLGARDALLSTNVELTSYGVPRGDRKAPDDPGAAVYFTLHGKSRVLACDRWVTVQANVAAVANHIDAIRRVDRYGVGTLDQAFAGYDRLPAPNADNRPYWRTVLHIGPDAEVTAEDVRLVYRNLAKAANNDQNVLKSLNLARDEALRELGVKG